MTRAKRIVNTTRASTVCERAVLADHPFSRMRGLLGRRELPAGQGLLLTPAPSIHTAFMRFAIDVLFLDADLRVLRIVERLAPWHAAFKRRARSVLELPAGEAARVGVRVGDRLALLDSLPALPGTRREDSDPEGDRTSAMLARQRATKKLRTPAPRRPPEQASPETEGRREPSMNVMVISSDRRFREVASLLLARRGCTVSLGDSSDILAECVDRNRAEVVVIDAERSLVAAARMAAAVQALSRTIGIVVVNDRPTGGLHNLRTIPKWGSFEVLFAAVQQAYAGCVNHQPLLRPTVEEAPS
jgi:uncharacterized protein